MTIENKITTYLKNKGAHFIYFADISHLPIIQTKEFPTAILFGKALTKSYIIEVNSKINYVPDMIREKRIQTDEFHLTELKTDKIADQLALFIQQNDFKAFSQSEKNLELNNSYNLKTQSTLLPHKTIALLAGMGWIGKHNLLVTPEFGSAISMCTVLTNAPLTSIRKDSMQSKCGDCTVCFNVCKPGALTNSYWKPGIERDEMMKVSKCTTCLQCMMQCPWTQNFAKM